MKTGLLNFTIRLSDIVFADSVFSFSLSAQDTVGEDSTVMLLDSYYAEFFN